MDLTTVERLSSFSGNVKFSRYAKETLDPIVKKVLNDANEKSHIYDKDFTSNTFYLPLSDNSFREFIAKYLTYYFATINHYYTDIEFSNTKYCLSVKITLSW